MKTRVVMAGMLAALSVSLQATDWTVIVKPALPQVPRIEVLHERSQQPGVCSGVVLNAQDGFLLTAAHCVEGDPAKLAITVNGRDATIEKSNRLLDLAVLKFKAKRETAMPLARVSPQIGSEVAVLGFAFGIERIAVQFGRVTQSYNDETKTLWLDASVIPGNSGGAVIDEQGRLVGMTSRVYYSGPSNVGAAIPIEVVEDFVEPFLPGKYQPREKR